MKYEKMDLVSSGRLGMGTFNPANTLHPGSEGSPGLEIEICLSQWQNFYWYRMKQSAFRNKRS